MPRAWAAAHADWDGQPGTWQQFNNPKTEDRYEFDHMNGTGPFMLDTWDRQAKEVILVRNDHYWRKPAALRPVVIRNVADLTARRLQLQQGDADMIWDTNSGYDRTPQQLSRSASFPSVDCASST